MNLASLWWVWLVGVLFSVGGGYFLWQGQQRLRARSPQGWLLGTGVVVGHEAVDSAESTIHLPVVEYSLPDGSLHRFTNPTTMVTGIVRTGHSVEILINPANPRQAQLKSTATTVRTMGGIFVVLGLMVMGLGVLILVGMGVATWLVLR